MEKRKIKNNSFPVLGKKAILAIVLFLFLGTFFVGAADYSTGNLNFSFSPSFANAADAAKKDNTPVDKASSAIANTLSYMVGGVINVVGALLSLLMGALIFVAEYNDFTLSDPVTHGWVIVRDLCNMFFILILLVIAFATILRAEGYDIKKMVPKLIIMAVLINFSKTICGIMIDFAQVVMNAFISPLAAVGSIKMTTMLGLNDLLAFNPSKSTPPADSWRIFGAYIFALAYTLIASVVLIVLLTVLIVRIIMIWIYVVLSPLAYLLATFPQGQKYVSQWWDEFTKNVIVGPILAFFLWLSLVSLGNTTTGTALLGNGAPTDSLIQISAGMPPELTKAMTIDELIKFAVAIGMLIGGLLVTQQMGGYMGKIAGQGMAKITGGAKWLGNKTKRILKDDAKVLGSAGLSGVGMLAGGIGKLQQKTGVGSGKSMAAVGNLGKQWGSGIREGVAKERAADWSKTLKKVGLGGAKQQAAVNAVADTSLGRGVKNVYKTGMGAVDMTLGLATGGILGNALKGFGITHLVSAARGFASGGAKNKRERTEEEVSDITKKRDDEIKMAENNYAAATAPAQQTFSNETMMYADERDRKMSVLDQDRAESMKEAGVSRDNVLKSAKVTIQNLDASFIGKEETHPEYQRMKDQADQEYEAKKKTIDDDYAMSAQPINHEYEQAVAPHRQALDYKTMPDKNIRDSAVAKAQADYTAAIGQTTAGKLRKGKADKITAIDNDRSLTTEEKNKQKSKVETDYGKREQNLSAGLGAKTPDVLRDLIKDFHPNQVTMDATKEVMALLKAAETFSKAIAAGDNFLQGRTPFYNTDGQGERSKEKFKALSGNPAALESMLRVLTELKNSGHATNDQKKSIKDLKQGLAAFAKGGGDTSKFSDIIVQLNGIPEGSPEDHDKNTSVEDFKDLVIEKS
jgi:hypothetical protein